MAGSYPDAPSRRMALDDDGTILLHRLNGSGTLSQQSSGTRAEMNDEDNVNSIATGASVDDSWIYWIFPELREFDGQFHAYGGGAGGPTTLHTSGDTTNGIDGTFTQQVSDMPNHVDVYALYRGNITSHAVSNVRCVRAVLDGGGSGGSKAWRASHIYGEIAAGETPDRLLWFDDDDDLEFSQPQDYGDVPRGSAEDHIIYLKNNSASLSAGSVQVTAEALYLGSASWYTFDDGTGFSATKALASSIANGANSPNITIRRITPDAETVGLHVARAYVSVGSWT